MNFTWRTRSKSDRPERLRPQLSDNHKLWSTLTTRRRVKRTQRSEVPNYWADSAPNCTGSHLRHRRAQVSEISSHLAQFDFFLFLNLKRAGIWVEWGGYRCGGLLCRLPENVLNVWLCWLWETMRDYVEE